MSDALQEINKALDRSETTWKHISEFTYSHQVSLCKNYQWLNVTIITALVAIYSEFIKENPFDSSYCFKIILTPYILATVCTLTSLIIGVLSLSSIWFKEPKQLPLMVADKCEYIVDRIITNGVDDPDYKKNLLIWAQWYDASIDGYKTLINKRGKLLRLQCYLTTFSIVLGIFSLYLLI